MVWPCSVENEFVLVVCRDQAWDSFLINIWSLSDWTVSKCVSFSTAIWCSVLASLDVLKTRVEPWIWNQETLIVDIVKNLTYLFVSLFLKLLEFKSWSNKLLVGSFAWNLGWAVMFIKLLNVCLQIDWKSKDLTYMEEVCNLGLVITLADFEL